MVKVLSDIPPSHLSYVLMPGSPSDSFNDLRLYDKAYQFWKSFWVETLDEVGANTSLLKSDDFLRQTAVTGLVDMSGSEPGFCALHCYCVFDLERPTAKDHSYFERYLPGAIDKIKAEGLSKIMTMEFLSVSKPFRSQKLGISLGHVLVSLGLKLRKMLQVDGIITSARADVGAANLAYRLGAKPLIKDLQINGCATDIVFWDKKEVATADREAEAKYIEKYWREKSDLLSGNQTIRFAA